MADNNLLTRTGVNYSNVRFKPDGILLEQCDDEMHRLQMWRR